MKQIVNFMLFLISTFMILILGDFYLQSSGIQDTSNNKFEPELGRIRRDGFEYVKCNEGFSISSFNQYSYLGEGYPPQKETGKIRIALIGDSYVEGFQVFERDHFRSILENSLNVDESEKYEILNFGRSGLGIENIYALDGLMIRKYNPDYILYFTGIADYYSSTNDPLIPSVQVIDSVNITINNHFPDSAIRTFKKSNPFLKRSAFLSMINNDRKVITSGNLSTKLFDKLAYTNKLDFKKAVSSPSRISQKNSLIMKKIAQDSKIVVVNRSDEEFPEEISNLLTNNNITQIDLSAVIAELSKTGIDPYYWKATNKYGHWNQAAHKAIGKYMAKEMKKMIEVNLNNEK